MRSRSTSERWTRLRLQHEANCEAVCQFAPLASLGEQGFQELSAVHQDICSVRAAGETSQSLVRCMQLPWCRVVAWRESRVRQQDMRLAGALDKTSVFVDEQIWDECASAWQRQNVGRRFWQRLSWRERLLDLFANSTHLSVADSILKSWRSLTRASQHLVRNFMLWRADLQRIPNQAKALIDEQQVFRRMRLSLSGSEGWHRSARLVKVRLRILLLFSFQRLSQNLQTIEAPEEMPHGRNSIRSKWKTRSCVLQTQRQDPWKRVTNDIRQHPRTRLLFGEDSLANLSL